jgi:hypothetical protein
MSEWRLIYDSGLAPRCMGFEYVSPGRRYELSLCVYYDERGQPHPFGTMRLTVNSLKTYEFKTYKQIKRYLQRKKVPLTGIEGLVSLWGEGE